MSFLKQDRPEKVKEIYRALKRDHPEMPAEMKARIAARQGKKGKQEQGPPYKGPIKPWKEKAAAREPIAEKVDMWEEARQTERETGETAARRNMMELKRRAAARQKTKTAKATFSPAMDKNPALKGKQSKLPDIVQAAIIKKKMKKTAGDLIKSACMGEMDKIAAGAVYKALVKKRIGNIPLLLKPKAWKGAWGKAGRKGHGGALEKGVSTLYSMRRPLTGVGLVAAPSYLAYKGGKSIHKDLTSPSGDEMGGYAPPY